MEEENAGMLLWHMALGAATGIAFGYVLQRSRMCMNTAFRDILLARDFTLFRAYLLAVLLQMVAVQVLVDLGALRPMALGYYPLAHILGGFVFGAGMAFAGGCSSGVWYRVGEGMVGAMAALIGFGLAAQATSGGILSPIYRALSRVEVDLGGGGGTLPDLLGVNPWWLVVPTAALLGAWLLSHRESRFQTGWRWPLAGAALGAVGVLGWLTSGATGRGWGLSVVGPTIGLVRLITEGQPAHLNWGTLLIVALPAGSFLAARSHGEFALRAPAPGRLLEAFGGGLLMGFGATVAGGCNIGHSFTGVSLLALSSLTTTPFIVLGVWSAVHLRVVRARAKGAREGRLAPAPQRVAG